MPKLEKLQNFHTFKRVEALKEKTEQQRKQVAEFTASAFYGDYQAVYLSEVKRCNRDEESYEFVTELIPSLRYGKTSEKKLLRMKELFASEEEVTTDEKWVSARLVHGYHHYNEKNPNRRNVVTDNIKGIFPWRIHWVNQLSISGHPTCHLIKHMV